MPDGGQAVELWQVRAGDLLLHPRQGATQRHDPQQLLHAQVCKPTNFYHN